MSNVGNTEWIYASANSIVALLLILILRTRELCTTDEINQGKVSGRVPLDSMSKGNPMRRTPSRNCRLPRLHTGFR